MQLIAGLGNPGAQYARNRHNIGFMAVEEIHRHHTFAPWRKKFQAQISEGQIDGEKVLLMKPDTFMNESGRAIREAMTFYKLGPEDILVVYDDMDLAPGKIRMKQGGGHGGHNGPRSIHAHIGGEYRRLRVGIGHPGDKNRVTNWVLSDFAKADRDWLDPLMDAIARHCGLLAKGQDANFASKVHLTLGGGARPAKRSPDAAKVTPAAPEKADAGKTFERKSSLDGKPSNPFIEAFGRFLKKSDGTK